MTEKLHTQTGTTINDRCANHNTHTRVPYKQRAGFPGMGPAVSPGHSSEESLGTTGNMGGREFFKGGATTEKAFCLPPYLGCSQQAPGGSSHLISTRMPSGEGLAVEPLCRA